MKGILMKLILKFYVIILSLSTSTFQFKMDSLHQRKNKYLNDLLNFELKDKIMRNKQNLLLSLIDIKRIISERLVNNFWGFSTSVLQPQI
ncbi:hypothetical protein pb186bvf_000850 [Paramecium bursaria]